MVAAHVVAQKAPVYWASPDAPTPVKRFERPQVRSTDTGFDAASAAVGAAGLGLIALLAVGATSVTGRRRMRPPR